MAHPSPQHFQNTPTYPVIRQMPFETELVTALSRTPISSEARNRARELLQGSIDWNAIVALATQWRVEPTVFGNLRSELSAAMPAEVRAEVATLEKQSRGYAVSRTLMLLDLVQSLESAGVPVIVLKGPAIAIMAYDDCSRRTFADSDLLVWRHDLGRARDLVIARGYAASFSVETENGLIAGQHALEFSDSRTAVELHWTLMPRHLRFNLNLDDLWSRSGVAECLDSKMRTLAPEYLYLYLCAHGAKHEWSLFRWICDIAQLGARLTPAQAESVMALASQANANRLLALGLRLVRAVFGDETSPFPSAAFGLERETAQLVALVKSRLVSDAMAPHGLLPRRIAQIHEYMEPLAFWLRSRERMIDRVACAGQFFFTPAAGDTSSGLQRAFRPVRLTANALRRLAHES